MNLSKLELLEEQEKLKLVNETIQETISSLGTDIALKEDQILEFRKFAWNQKASLDSVEMKAIFTDDTIQANFLMNKEIYFKKLFQIQNSPYFASIIFEEEDEDRNVKEKHEIYIALTYLKKDNKRLLYDWRSPICGLFYDYELGLCQYEAPGGIVKGTLKQKRQYKIEDGKLKRIFDNSINIDDELLQEVLASESSEKMKNIVNTIQQEQNTVIRNTKDKNLIVQGIAGSGKTSVALHRVAFLLYKIPKLTSSNVLIFSPNNIFTEYISNVLPELGENNTLQTTFQDYLQSVISEYKNIEPFVDFIARYYTQTENNERLVAYKQSDEIIKDLEDYVVNFISKAKFEKGIVESHINEYSKQELNETLKRYSHIPLFERINIMADRMSEFNYNGTHKRSSVFRRLLKESFNLKRDFKQIYYDFYKSNYCKIKLSDEEISEFVKRRDLNYEDALLFVYLKGILEGFPFETNIFQIVIDEAQDYSRLQYIILSKIFKKANFTILGDINQTINPYYKYTSLENLQDIIKSRYIELNKTYRSSASIIEYTNKILNLEHVSAIRKGEELPVIEKNIRNLKEDLLNDINYLSKKYKSIAIITKDNYEAIKIYELMKDKIEVTLIDSHSSSFKKEIIVIPAYLAKGLEFDSVIIKNDKYNESESYLFYVACTRAQHELIVYK